MNKWKNEQRERKKAEGKNITVVQPDSSSMSSSSDEEDLDRQERIVRGEGKQGTKDKLKAKLEEPGQMVANIRKGDREREERETEDDMAGSRQ